LGSIARFGAGLFFGDIVATSNGRSLRAETMSSFSRRETDGSNASLRAGQPNIPANCTIPPLDGLPAFAKDYRDRRAAPPGNMVFETEYEIIPGYDINGVGLVYFAAYPMIHDICAARYDRRIAIAFSTKQRDVFYFGNSEPDDKIVFRIHAWRECSATVEIEASLSRGSDGATIAYIVTTKGEVRG
jgi:probable biosynthetic protein (TIGR04098 family)